MPRTAHERNKRPRHDVYGGKEEVLFEDEESSRGKTITPLSKEGGALASSSAAASVTPLASSSCGICGGNAYGIMLGCKGPEGENAMRCPFGTVAHLVCNVEESEGRCPSYHCARCGAESRRKRMGEREGDIMM